MNKRLIVLLSVCGLVLVGSIALLFKGQGDTITTNKTKLDMNSSESKRIADFIFEEPEFADAPNPEEMELAQAEVLWPFALEKKPNRKEEVKEEWREFAAKHPNNFYIPREMRPKPTEAEEKIQIQTMETFAAMDAMQAASVSKSKWSDAANAKEPNVRPEPKDQKVYFDYKIHELESRIQMIEYWMENKQPTSATRLSAEKDIQLWKKELTSLKEIRSQVPNT
ncbi:hypothetical protein P3G55_05730 [Leptospira sp. 96542]|nr:hypothetical protein [Leptospira sp. 96542]